MKKRLSTEARALALHKKLAGKVGTECKVVLKTRDDWALYYTPGVGAVSRHIGEHPDLARNYTIQRNTVAVISDGSAVLGLGNIGPLAALPVLEGKALIFKQCAGIDAYPIVLGTQDTEKIIDTILAIAPGFGGINLEDISAPRCFEIEECLKQKLAIPVMHDDQHGTAIVVLAGLINAAKVTKRRLEASTVVVNGVGAAGTAVMRLVKQYAPSVRIIAVDSKGIIGKARKGLDAYKKALLGDRVIEAGVKGGLEDALRGADIFIGLSQGNLLTGAHVRTMNPRSIIFALANPTPEILPMSAYASGAGVVATGRSDFPNQVNNALAFPGVFRGALDRGVTQITDTMKLRAAKALAGMVRKPTRDLIIPSVLDAQVSVVVAKAIR